MLIAILSGYYSEAEPLLKAAEKQGKKAFYVNSEYDLKMNDFTDAVYVGSYEKRADFKELNSFIKNKLCDSHIFTY